MFHRLAFDDDDVVCEVAFTVVTESCRNSFLHSKSEIWDFEDDDMILHAALGLDAFPISRCFS